MDKMTDAPWNSPQSLSRWRSEEITQGYNDKDKKRWSICNVEWTVLFDLLLCVILIPINLLLYIKAETC